MPEIKQLTAMFSQPGIQRDGTLLDANFYADGQWVRFQRGRPRKIGGYQLISAEVSGPVRAQFVWPSGLMHVIYSFSSDDITATTVDANGVGGAVYFLTPAAFALNTDWIWSVDSMYDAGGANSIIIAVATSALTNIDDSTARQVYYGVAGDTATDFVDLTGLTVSGGICVVEPYLVYYGSEGLVGWTDANQPLTLTGGDAGTARVTGAKVVKGLSLNSGNGPAALLWSLDSIIRMDWTGGAAVFRFNTISGQSSVLSQNGIIEYDNKYYWPGIDRFLVYEGGSVVELPNNQNLNWFYDNLNFACRQKVWAMKIPRYGEIWWFFPFGDATECTHAVILNVREKIWYDCELARSAGYYSQVFPYPVMSSTSSENRRWLRITISAGTFNLGDVINGTTSLNTATILRVIDAGNIIVYMTVAGTDFTVGEGLDNLTVSGTATYDSEEVLGSIYVHEKGMNALNGEIQNTIDSYFETCDFGYLTGSAQPNQPTGPNQWTRIVRIEPDFVQEGDMTVVVTGKEWANSDDVDSDPYTFDNTTEKIDMREQRREIRLRFRSNAIDGDFQTGNVLLHIEPGDKRS